MGFLLEIWRYRQALMNFVARDLTVRYKRSFFGFVWSFLNPLLLILTFLVVFRYLWPNPEKNYSVKLFCTLLAWRFFNTAVMDISASVSTRLGLIKRVNFPRIILPTSSLIANFVDYLLSLVILVVVFAAVRLTGNWPFLGLAAAALIIQIVFTFGLGLMLASVSVFFTDVQFLVSNLFQMWLFITPVIYQARFVVNKPIPEIYKTIYFLNPMAPLMMAYRSIVPNEVPTDILPNYYTFLAASGIVALVTLLAGLLMFRKYEHRFAKEV